MKKKKKKIIIIMMMMMMMMMMMIIIIREYRLPHTLHKVSHLIISFFELGEK